MQDPVLGAPAMKQLKRLVRNAPDLMEVADAGHFTQEWGVPIAETAVAMLR